MDQRAAFEPCYSARLVEPFVKLLVQQQSLAGGVTAAAGSLDPDRRIPIADAHALLERAIAASGDASLGLKAGRLMTNGDCGVVDYVISSAATVRSAIDMAARYGRLVNDAIAMLLSIEGERAILRIESAVPMPKGAADFLLSALYATHTRTWLSAIPSLECWFVHPAPADLGEYQRSFERASLRFSAPFYAFVFDRKYLDSRPPSADPKLHAVVREHAEMMLAARPSAHSLTERVRSLMVGELQHGRLTAQQAAQRLRMSRRTLCRRLESEGTTFSELSEDLRHRLALQYVGKREMGLSEVAFLLGFSETAAFHRAFKRWTGQTPLEYRRSCST